MSLSFDLIADAPAWGDEQCWHDLFLPILDQVEKELSQQQDLEFAVLLADDTRLQGMNLEWRGKDSPTNVLSFPASGQTRALGNLGDIAMSHETLEREAAAQGKALEAHAAHLFLHGLLHLLGFDHDTTAKANEMEGLETKILLALGYADPYEEDCKEQPTDP